MNTLRWTLGAILVFFGGGFIFISVVGGGFRKSFGASANSPLLTVLPLLALLLLLAGLVFPGSKPLLHTAAAAALALIGFCVWQMIAEAATITWVGIAYLVAWLIFYWMAAWKPVASL